jgi:glucose-1-phosphate cytidylyltransferase
MIKEYFLNYFLYNADVEIDLNGNSMKVLNSKSEEFKITLIDTGEHTKTAGRLKRILPYVGREDFMLTYGDGVADIDIASLLKFHQSHGKIATVTAIPLEARFGGMDLLKDGTVSAFREKAKDESKWINGGFFVLKPEIVDFLEGDMDQVMWEDDPLEKLSLKRQLAAYRHMGFWKPMDALRDKIELDNLWAKGDAKWRVWG